MKTYHHLFARVRERWLDCRNRLLADPRVQHAAQRFPLSRPIARRRAGALFDMDFARANGDLPLPAVGTAQLK